MKLLVTFSRGRGRKPIIAQAVRDTGAQVRILDHGVSLDESECVDCGVCISICPREVFSFDAEWKLRLDEKKCILCGKCIDACPHRALSLPL